MKSVVVYSIIGASALAVGASGGIIYKRCFVAPSEEIVGFNPDKCMPDGDELIAKVEKAGSKKQATQTLRPFEIALYAFENYKRCEYSVSYCEGTAKTIINQSIRSAQVRRGNSFFEEQISKSSMVGVGKRMLQDGAENEVKVYNETSSDNVIIDETQVHATFKEQPDTYTPEAYKEAWGRKLQDMSIHLIGESTVETEKLESTEGGYRITLDLQPQKGGYNYRYQMKTISGLDDYPSFQNLTVTFFINEELEMVKLTENCKYHALMGVSVDIENDLTYHYFPNREFKIPELNEDFDYIGVKEVE